jgi:hypothetical protein
MDTFRVNAAVVPRQEQQAFIPIYYKDRGSAALWTDQPRNSQRVRCCIHAPEFSKPVESYDVLGHA